jgi:glycosyltransferase involved in cell wall biosynthesis
VTARRLSLPRPRAQRLDDDTTNRDVQPTRLSIVCLSPSGWEVALPTNRQQIMRRVAGLGHDVLFVETGPFFGRHLAGVLRRRVRVRSLVRPSRVSERVRTLAALNIIPWGHRRAWANRINCRLTAWWLRRLVRRHAVNDRVVLWIYDPCAAWMIGSCAEDLALYDCVDDFTAVEHSDARVLELAARGDRLAASRSNVVATTTAALFERHRAVNPNTHLVPNVGDFDHFAPAADRSAAAADVRLLTRPVIGFGGALTTGKVDFAMFGAVARAHPEWSLLLVGPADEAAGAHLTVLLQTHPNVRWVGAKSYEEMPTYVAAFDVALCPNAWNRYGQSCFPLKLYEYLAAGKPVVASGTPDLADMEPDVRLAKDPTAFVRAVELALLENDEGSRRRRMATASVNTWETRTARLVELVFAGLEAAAGRTSVAAEGAQDVSIAHVLDRTKSG